MNPLFQGTLLGEPPAWEIIKCDELNGWQVRVHGRYVMDGETGKRALFKPPREIRSISDLEEWNAQMKRTVGRLAEKRP